VASHRILVIDGYNLIYHFPGVGKILERDRDQARRIMVAGLGRYARQKGVQIKVVFDGDMRQEDAPVDQEGIQVHYSRFPEKADSLIMRIAEKHRESEDISVVTSDGEIDNWCRRKGVHVIPSQNFAHTVGEGSREDAQKKYDHAMGQSELKQWIKLFEYGSGTDEEDGPEGGRS
jgi:predicted RNA-binding protein with PIN domain